MIDSLDRSETLKRMAIVCSSELNMPTYNPKPGSVAINVYLKRWLKGLLGRSIRRPRYDYFWTTAILADAVIDYCDCTGDVSLLINVKKYHDSSLNKVGFRSPKYLDEAMNGKSMIDNWEKSQGDAEAIGRLAEFLIYEHKKTSEGILPYRQTNPDHVLVDTIGMICPFLAKYGLLFDNEAATRLAIDQILKFIENGFSNQSGFPYHGYGELSGINLGGEGWGRGVGWFLMGIVGVLEYIQKENPSYSLLADKYADLVTLVFNEQAENGAFPIQFLGGGAEPDSGATGMIANACLKGVELGLIKSSYFNSCSKAMDFIYSVTGTDGRVQECSGEALGANSYSCLKGWFPWGQGPAVSLGARLLRSDINAHRGQVGQN